MSKQSLRSSLIEATLNTVVGFLTAIVINWFAARLYGIPMPTGENVFIVVIFTMWSWTRQFLIRRIFVRFF